MELEGTRKSKCSISPYAYEENSLICQGSHHESITDYAVKEHLGPHSCSFLRIKPLQCNLSFSSSLDIQSCSFIRKKDKQLMSLVTVFYRSDFWSSEKILVHHLYWTYGSLSSALLPKPRSTMNVMGAWTLLPVEMFFWPPGTNLRACFWSREKEVQGPFPHQIHMNLLLPLMLSYKTAGPLCRITAYSCETLLINERESSCNSCFPTNTFLPGSRELLLFMPFLQNLWLQSQHECTFR